MKAFIKLQSDNRLIHFKQQQDNYIIKQQMLKSIQNPSTEVKIGRIHQGRKMPFERIKTCSGFQMKSSKQILYLPIQNESYETQLIIGKSFYKKKIQGMQRLDHGTGEQQQLIEALLFTQGLPLKDFIGQPLSRTLYRKGDNSVIKKFTSMSPKQKDFLKIERPMTELLKSKNFTIKKQKVPYLRLNNQEEDLTEKKEIEKIMELARQSNCKSISKHIHLDRLLQIEEEQEQS